MDRKYLVRSDEALPEAKIYDGKVFPLTFYPGKDQPPVGQTRLSEWASANRKLITQKAMEHGAILFRGFDLRSPEEQAAFFLSLGLKSMPYVGGAAVRTSIVGDIIMTTNESPPEEPIPFHHEMAQVPNPPTHLCFMCNIAAKKGGATPILRSDVVYTYLAKSHPKLCVDMETKGVKYVRVMPQEDDESSPIGRSWKNTFNAKTKAQAEIEMKKLNTTWEWLPDGSVKTTTATVPAIREDKRTGKKVFFNSVVAAFIGWIDSRNDPKKAVVFGDGTPINPKALEDIANFMDKEKVSFPWLSGDVLLVDNTVCMHSRQPFEGPRRVLASVFQGHVDTKYTMPNAVLTSGAKMPVLGLGMWKIPKTKCQEIIVEAVKAGYRHFDNACDYGNEQEVGDGIAKVLESKLVSRDQLWITSKLWNTFHAKEHVRMACLKSMKDLGVKYLDLYLIQYPPEWSYEPEAKLEFTESIVQSNVPIVETWAAMEELVQEGLVRNIGVANFNCSLLREILNTCKIKPAVNQVELHPYLLQSKLIRFCRKNGIHVTGFSPLGASSYVELGCSATEKVIDRKEISEIAKKIGKSPGQVLLRWGVQRGTSIIPKTTKVARLKENISIFDFELSKEDVDSIDALNLNKRFNDPGVFADIPIWD
ncbi:hypothetical protein AAMO2058_001618900 [Amorphochlora amoebiformis]